MPDILEPPLTTGGPVQQAHDVEQARSAPEREFTIKARSQSSMIVRRFLTHRLAVASLVVFGLLIVLSLVGGRVWTYNYADVVKGAYSKPPSLQHPMGTDGIGHDVFAQVLRGAQKSVQIALLVAILSTMIGSVVGAIAGYYRGWVDALLMRFVDLVLTIPSLAILAVLGARFSSRAGGWFALALVLAFLLWAPISRIVRGQFLSLREKEYVESARALGASDARIIFRHLLPNALGPIIVNATVLVAVAILTETALSYLGLGIKPPDTSLGLLIQDGQAAAQTRPWLFYFPGLFIILIALTVNFIGDGLRDAFDPTQTRVRA
ncbi:MAG: ABC transporter permease [Actinomycetota bacterium]|nr:ABC transporter permease [Actinomycetota bacterium]